MTSLSASNSSHCFTLYRYAVTWYISVNQNYFILSGNDDNAFRLVSGTGSDAPLQLAVSAPLDHETTTDYHLVLAAVDGGDPPKTGLVTVHISVADSNDNRPVSLVNHCLYTFLVSFKFCEYFQPIHFSKKFLMQRIKMPKC